MGRPGRRGVDPDVMRKRSEISAEFVVEFLNQLVRMDKHAISDLVSERVMVNKELEKHPTVQTREVTKGVMEVGFLGILNGMFGIEGDKVAIEAVKNSRTGVVEEFRLTEPWKGVFV